MAKPKLVSNKRAVDALRVLSSFLIQNEILDGYVEHFLPITKAVHAKCKRDEQAAATEQGPGQSEAEKEVAR